MTNVSSLLASEEPPPWNLNCLRYMCTDWCHERYEVVPVGHYLFFTRSQHTEVVLLGPELETLLSFLCIRATWDARASWRQIVGTALRHNALLEFKVPYVEQVFHHTFVCGLLAGFRESDNLAVNRFELLCSFSSPKCHRMSLGEKLNHGCTVSPLSSSSVN